MWKILRHQGVRGTALNPEPSAPVVIVVSGLDPTGVAGLFADIRALASAGVRIAPIISASTVQGSAGLTAFHPVPPDIVGAQLREIFSNHEPSALKIGVLGSVDIAWEIIKILDDNPVFPVVLDPVMKATHGKLNFADAALRNIIVDELIPRCTIVTPNLPELAWLNGLHGKHVKHSNAHARALLDRGCEAVLVKGGHRNARPVDVLYVPGKTYRFSDTRLPGTLRGTGCHLASFLAAQLALGKPIPVAVRRARSFVRRLFSNYAVNSKGLYPAGRFFRRI